MFGYWKVFYDIYYFYKMRVFDLNFIFLEYFFYVVGVNLLVFEKKKYVYVYVWICVKLFGNEMCVLINGNNGFVILGCFF